MDTDGTLSEEFGEKEFYPGVLRLSVRFWPQMFIRDLRGTSKKNFISILRFS
jgi:hypothetical protein